MYKTVKLYSQNCTGNMLLCITNFFGLDYQVLSPDSLGHLENMPQPGLKVILSSF